MFTKFLSFGARQLRPPQLSWWIVHIISFLKKIHAANRQEILAVLEWSPCWYGNSELKISVNSKGQKEK